MTTTPDRARWRGGPRPRPLPAPWHEHRRLVTDDGVAISAVHAPGDRDDLGLVVAHGFTGSWSRPDTTAIAGWLLPYGGVVGFDFRGHGRSYGHTTVGDLEVLDVDATLRWARLLGYKKVATVGFSMGGSVVVRQAGLRGGVDAVVAVSSPARWYYRGTPAMRRTHWAVERPSGRLVTRVTRGTRVRREGWQPVPAEPRVAAGRIAPVPLLVVHGDRDSYFPLDHAEDLVAGSGGHAELWTEAGFGHGESGATAELVTRIGGWVRAAVGLPADGDPPQGAR